MKIIYSIASILIGICAISHASAAAQVDNLTDIPQAIVLDNGGNPQLIEIAPNGRYSTASAFHMKYRNQELYVEENMEYAIWPGNVIGPQRVRKSFIRGN